MTVAHSALKLSLIAVNYTYLILLLLQHFLLLAILLMLIIVMEDFILKHSLGESLFYGRFPEQIDLLFSQGLCQGFLQMTSKGKNKHISFPLVVCFWVDTLQMWVTFRALHIWVCSPLQLPAFVAEQTWKAPCGSKCCCCVSREGPRLVPGAALMRL